MDMLKDHRLVLLGLAAVAVPLAAGCSGDLPGLTVPALSGDSTMNNSRTAYLVTDGGNNTKAVTVGRAKANFTANGLSSNYTVATNDIHDMTGMVGALNTYSNASGQAVVIPQPDVDGNGTATDNFLVMTRNNPVNPNRTERSLAYQGPISNKSVIEGHRKNQKVATYTGIAGVTGQVGGNSVSASGTVSMTADFYKASVQGNLNNLIGATQFDGANFKGTLTNDLSDFEITEATLTKGGGDVTDKAASGVGSFMGANGQGVMGVFGKSSLINGTGDFANVFGHFAGSADSLK